MKHGVCCFLALMALTHVVAAAGTRSIFDEDWTPPKASETQRPAAVKPIVPSPPPADPAKVERPVEAPKDPAPAVAPAVRRAIPAKAEQAAARKVLKEVFSDQLVDRSPPARYKLTQALHAQAESSGDRPVDQFVLLAAAVDAGTEAANLRIAFDAGDRMAKGFDVDALALKAETVARMGGGGGKGAAADAAAENVKVGLALVDQLAAADDPGAAARVCAALLPVAGGNAGLRADVQRRQRELTAAREAGERVARHVEKLKTAPDDPTANLEVGKYLCFFKNEWSAGLAALARGGDPALKALATKELAGADTADARAALGDAWWDLAQAGAGPNKPAMLARAAEWYAKAAPDLKGLIKAKVDKRLAQSEPKTPATGAGVALSSGTIDAKAIIRTRPAGGTSVLLFKSNLKALADFEAVSGGKVVVAGPDQIARLFASPNLFAKYNVIVWEANALCDCHIDLDASYGDTMRRFVEMGGDIVFFEQFRDVNWQAIEKPFGIKRVQGGPHELGPIDPALGAKLKAAGIGDDELAKIRLAIAVEVPERSKVLVRNKRDQVLGAVLPVGKGRVIFTSASGEVDHLRFDRVFFEYLFPHP